MEQNETGEVNSWQYLTTFCHTSDCCPEAFWNEVPESGFSLKITDDWGYDAYFPADRPPSPWQFRNISQLKLREYGITDLPDPMVQYVMLKGYSGMAFMTSVESGILLDEINELVDKQRAVSR